MLLKDISAIVDVLQALIKLVEIIDPNAQNNAVVMKIQGAINELHSMNL